MMRGNSAGILAIAIFASTASSAAASNAHAKPSPPAALAKGLIADCGTHRFETRVRLSGADGKSQEKLVQMCGFKGESDADWIITLKDAMKKTGQNPAIPQAAREQIIAAVKAEIDRLSLPALVLPNRTDIAKLPKTGTLGREVPLSRDYAALPPLPAPSNVPPPHVLEPDGAMTAKARLSLRCALEGDEDRAGECDSIDKDTLLVVRAEQPLPSGVAVRFLRHGDERAEVDLPAMKAGEVATLHLPPRVCAGVVRSSLEIEALGSDAPSGTAPATIGEYDLRC